MSIYKKPAPAVQTRYVIQGTLRMTSPTTLSNGESGLTDIVVRRDQISGRPMLPGTTLAGALRAYLARRLQDQNLVKRLFGYQDGQKSVQSRIFVDNGVIWGTFTPDGLVLSSDVYPQLSPEPLLITLQQARLFGPLAELFICSVGGTLKASLLQGHDPLAQQQPMLYFNDRQLLWGSEIVKPYQSAFTLVQEGECGFPQALPLEITESQLAGARATLAVRRYIDYSPNNRAYVKYSRLLDLVI